MKYLLIFLIAISFLISSCGDDTDDNGGENTPYTVNINIVSPSNGASFTVGETGTIKVEFTNDDIIHNVKIELLNIDNQQNEVIFDEHIHQQQTFTYENIKNFDTAGHFVMTVSSTNMEETEEVKQVIELDVL